MLEKLENELFSEFDWKSWKAIGFSPALAGKAGILFLGLIIISSIIRSKMILSRNRIAVENVFQYHVGQTLFLQVNPGLKVVPMFCQGWLVDPCRLGMLC